MRFRSGVCIVLAVVATALTTQDASAGGFKVPYDAKVYASFNWGSAGASSEFGLGTSAGNFRRLFSGLPNTPSPKGEVLMGTYAAGATIDFAIHTGASWAFSSGSDPIARECFTDWNNNLGMGGNIYRKVNDSTWLMYCDDAWSSDDDDNDFVIQLRLGSISWDVCTLTIYATPGGSVVDPSEGSFDYPRGTLVFIQATPNPGYHFTGWSGSFSDPTNPTWITMDGDYTIQANFENDPSTLKYRVHGDLCNCLAKRIGGVEIRLRKGGSDGPIAWTGKTNVDGSYTTEEIDADASFWSGSDWIEAVLDNPVVRVVDYSKQNDPATAKVKITPDPDLSLIKVDFESALISDESPGENRDGIDAFCQISLASWVAIERFSFSRPKIEAYIGADAYTNRECSGIGCFSPPDCWNPFGSEKIHFPLGGTYNARHEYGHAMLYSLYGCWRHGQIESFGISGLVKPEMDEGWATYFASIPKSPHEESAEKPYLFKYAPFADVLLDINDGGSEDKDNDGIDGVENDGLSMIWTVLRDDTPVSLREFYQKFAARFGFGKELCEIYKKAYGVCSDCPGQIAECNQGRVGSGQITSGRDVVDVVLDSTVSEALFRASWPGSDLDLTLTTPNGTTIDPVYAEQDPNVMYVEGTTEEYYTVEHPEPGEWQMHVTAVDVPPEGEDYTATVSLTTNLMLILSTDKDTYGLDEPIALRSKVLYDANSYAGPILDVQVQTPQGIETITLFDDGLHDDANSADGVYANIFTNTAIEGPYTITATASGLNPFGEPFVRQTSKTVLVRNLPDLTVVDLTISPGPARGQVTLTAHVLNGGTKDANGILVAFYDANDANMVQIGGEVETDHLGPGDTKDISTIWDAPDGEHSVLVVVDHLNAIVEADETNNTFSETFSMEPQPVAHWRFDEATGTKASDSAGSNPGTVNGTQWGTGRIGGALRFDGWDDYADCGNAAVLAPERMTVAFWVFVEGKTTFQYLLGKAPSLSASKDYALVTGGDGKLEFSFGESAYKQVTVRSTEVLPLGQWVYVAATRDGGTASLYLDGQLEGSAAYSFAVTDKGQSLRIGSIGLPEPEWAGFFKGKIDDVRIYDEALSLQEIQELYKQVSP